ncbi:MAG: hydroxylamine oxidase [Proteobacteria bacterium]|nr:hydroxylamine oxidase [Pseudomonadota bacterium]
MSVRFFIKGLALLGLLVLLTAAPWAARAEEAPISEATENCLTCHGEATPGIVADWRKSPHASATPAQALGRPETARRVSAASVPERLAKVAVGCAECHTLAPERHADTFDHEGERVHVVVTPKDCAVCHPVESGEYENNKMALAHGNLKSNTLYNRLVEDVLAGYAMKQGELVQERVDPITGEDACYHCHGTEIKVTGKTRRETDQGDFEFPVLSGWPNQGVGRLNPDQSRGACTACHTRHQFSVKTARQPYTCSQCHKGPDVPAYKTYMVSKHGNLFSSHKDEWDMKAVPWMIGRDFTAPTCAACHVSLLVDSEGRVVVKRTHQMNDRLPWRLLGLIYAHPQPKSPDTTVIRNRAGLPLPTELTGEPAAAFLIDDGERARRRETMQKACRSCHSAEWVQGHWVRLERAIETTNGLTFAATALMTQAWDQGLAHGLPQASPFDEALERKWTAQWLFYANSTRLASAMGGADHGVFDQGRWDLSRNLMEMRDWMRFLRRSETK